MFCGGFAGYKNRRNYAFKSQHNQQIFRTFELDDSYFRAKRGRGAAGKTPVFGLLKRDGNLYVEVVESCSRE